MDAQQQPSNPALADLDALLAERGVTVTPDGEARARDRRRAALADWQRRRQEVRDRVDRGVADLFGPAARNNAA